MHQRTLPTVPEALRGRSALADWLARESAEPSFESETYLLTGPEAVTYEQGLAGLAAQVAKAPARVRVSYTAFRAISWA